jgi:hypothetical protein
LFDYFTDDNFLLYVDPAPPGEVDIQVSPFSLRFRIETEVFPACFHLIHFKAAHRIQ